MARTDLPAAQALSAASPLAAVTMTAVDAANGNQWVFKGDQICLIRNASGASITVTVKSGTTIDGLAVPDRAITVAAGATAAILEASVARQPANGKIYIDFSSGTTVTAGLIDPV